MDHTQIGIYETILYKNFQVLNFNAHYNRLKRGAKFLSLSIPKTKTQILSDLIKLFQKSNYSQARIRLTLNQKTLTYEIFEIPNLPIPQKVVTYKANRPIPQIKSTNRETENQALEFAKTYNAVDAILINQKGFLTEGSISNLFVVKNQQLLTPYKSILKGTFRQQVLKTCAKLGIKVHKKAVHSSQINQFTEIFICNAIKGIVPIFEINYHKLPKQNPITKKIINALTAS
jgi:branched-subunit amino acid aminotransferase/4-amino-4-deoxychorismate lyase